MENRIGIIGLRTLKAKNIKKNGENLLYSVEIIVGLFEDFMSLLVSREKFGSISVVSNAYN